MLIYRYLFFPVALLLLRLFKPFLGPKIKHMFAARKRAFESNTNCHFWIHCASGEFEYARPVIRELKDQFPEHKILVTYMSPSIEKSVQNDPHVDVSVASPWDRPKELKNLIQTYSPKILLIARTDAWPEMLTQAKKAKIKSLLFSATLAKNSSRLKWPSRWLTSMALRRIDQIFCVSEEDKMLLTQVAPIDRIKVEGDTRFDQVQHRLAHPKMLKEELKPQANHNLRLILGSTWPEDEEIWLRALKDIYSFDDKALVVIAPHEPSKKHLESLTEKIKAVGYTSALYSEASSLRPKEVLLIDQVGILADLYAWGNLAFVGGSFKKQVHSVMEPLAQGLHCLVGPYHQNNREALAFSGKDPLVHPVGNTEEVLLRIKNLKHLWSNNEEQKRVQSLLENQQGATASVIDWVKAQT